MSNEQAEQTIKNLGAPKERKAALRQMNNAISLLYVNNLITRAAMVSARRKFMVMLDREVTKSPTPHSTAK